MTEREALLRAVCESPDDDLPRLVFADWLEEHGDAGRAEFIRLQCANVRRRTPRQMTDKEYLQYSELFFRDLDLLNEHGGRWMAELISRPGMKWGAFHRGFVEDLTAEVRLDGVTFDELNQIVTQVPVRRLTLRGPFEPHRLAQLRFVPAIQILRLPKMAWSPHDWQWLGHWWSDGAAGRVARYLQVDRSDVPPPLHSWFKESCNIDLVETWM